MKLFLLIVAIVQLAVADLIVNNSQPNYEYDVNRNGYVPFHNPNIVNLRPLYANIPLQYQDFANRTLAKQPHGVCQKEVPLVFFYINFHNFFSSFSLWLLPKFFLFFSVISLPSWKKYHSKFNILFRTSSLLETGATAPRGNGVNQFKIKLFLWTKNHHNFIWFNFFFSFHFISRIQHWVVLQCVVKAINAMRTYSVNVIRFVKTNVSTEFVTHQMNVFAIQITWRIWPDIVCQLVQLVR